MVKKISLVIVLLLSFSFYSEAQRVGIGGTFDIMNPVGKKKFMPGVSVFVDVPKSGSMAIYGKLGYYFPVKYTDSNAYVIAIDPMTSPYQRTAQNETKISTFSLQGGTKYFVGNDYNVGFSGQFDTHFKLMFSPVKSRITGYDATKYQPDPNNQQTAASYKALGLYAGASAGLKYSKPWGTLFASASLDILLYTNYVTPITSLFVFGFHVGYRRDIY